VTIIDAYIEKLQSFLQRIVDAIVSWAIFSRYVKLFWNADCDEITKESRRLRRIWSATHDRDDWKNYMQLNDRKQKIIQKVKRLNFRQKIEKTTDISTSLWWLARWAKNKSHSSREISKMSVLKYNDQIADIFDDKVEMFKSIFFLASSSVDLNDIESSFYSIAIDCSIIVIEDEIAKTIDRIFFHKTSSSNDITNRLIKAWLSTFIKLLISLFQTCAEHEYHSKVFKTTNTITLKKINEENYVITKTYRFIILLNIIEKIMKSIMSKKISWLAKSYRILLESHMNVRFERFIQTALELLTKQTHIVWNQNTNRIAILLSLNVIEAFDSISHSRLIHNLKRRKISQWIINWVSSFMSDKSITLAISQRIFEFFAMFMRISQDSFISSLLYLFYNANLLKMCDKFDTLTRSLEYANDVNILTYEKSTKKNCKTLEKMHRLCEKWANRHEFVFASTKYELIHFTRNSKKFNMTIIINIDNNVIKSKTNIRVLNLQINIKLKWRSHVRKIQKKMIKQSMILFKIFAFIWRIIFSKTRRMYIFVIRSIMIYVSSMWHTLKQKKTNIENKLTMLQNKCLRTMSKIFRVTLVSMLEVEIHIVSMNIHLNQLQTLSRFRFRIEFIAKYIAKSCKNIVYKLRDRTNRRRHHRFISKKLKSVWIKKQLTIIIVFFLQKANLALWSTHFRIASNKDKFIKQRIREIKVYHEQQWKKRWTTYQKIVLDLASTQTDLINKKRFKLHAQLRKAENTLTMQIRTKKIDFADFFHRRTMLEIDSSTCRCEWNRQSQSMSSCFVSWCQTETFFDATLNILIIIKWCIQINLWK
jgi:hypothetical protein